jgi:phage shock protein PspC (stress-responsive transcriptional regulator)
VNDRLYRSRTDRMLAGVAGGLAEMWDADPSLVRIVWALLIVFTGGIALVVYIVMAIVVPEEPYDEMVYPGWPPSAGTGAGPMTGSAMPLSGDAAPSSAGEVPGPVGAPAPTPTHWVTPGPMDRDARHAAREARRAARAERTGGLSAGLIGGAFLVLLGLFFLAREWLPQIDFDWFWPLVLVALGVVLLLTAVRRDTPGSGGPS